MATDKEYEDICCHFPTSFDNSSFSAWNLQYLGIFENEVDSYTLMDPFASSSDIVPSSSLIPVPDFIGGAFDVCDQKTPGFDQSQKEQQLLPSDPRKEYIDGEIKTECDQAEPAEKKMKLVTRNSDGEIKTEYDQAEPVEKKMKLVTRNSDGEIEKECDQAESAEKKMKLGTRNSLGSSKTLCRDTISKFFYMPITQAAKELNVGVTLLKKTCRDLGIRRWPHRKLISLQTLIKNVQELGKYEGEEKLKRAVSRLEEEMKLMVKIPDMEIEGKTKRLRQACFKANCKKSKLVMGNPLLPLVKPANHRHDFEEDEDDLKAFFSG
ncbi:uncharacterized protein [Henckelia pumila]|uniref:uncharacterized protein n=1 Tax=Henckelia pumila TaxID=405737 RepID=UPI003C6E9A06